jgi:hypothetical protein
VQLRNGASVRSPDGVLGVIEARRDDPPGRVTLRLGNGREALLPEELLTPETDGTYRTTVTSAQLHGAASVGPHLLGPTQLGPTRMTPVISRFL